METMLRGVTLAGAFLLGSIPFSYLVGRWRGVDVRKVGSGNPGATNVMRSAGKAAGILALVLDALKGTSAVLVAQRVESGAQFGALAAVLAVLGHMYTPWLGFRGGKGVATGAGALLPLAPAATGGAVLLFGLVAVVTRYVSLASIAGSIALAVGAFLLSAPPPVSRAAAGLALLIVWKHRSNLQRIAQGAESRLGRKTAPPAR